MENKKSLKFLISGLCVIVFGLGFASILKNTGISYALDGTGKSIEDYYCPLGNYSSVNGTSTSTPTKNGNNFVCNLYKNDNNIALTASSCSTYIQSKGSSYGITSGIYDSTKGTCSYDPIMKSCYLCASSSGSVYRWTGSTGSSCTLKSEYTTKTACEAANNGTEYSVSFYSILKGKDSTDDTLWYLYKNGSNFTGVNLSYPFKSTSPLDLSKYSGKKDGFTFNGWDTTNTCSNPKTTGTVALTDDKVIYACFTKNSSSGGDTPATTYAVTFNMEVGDVLKKNGTTQSSKTFNLSSINYADWTATRSGNTFNGWATSTSACANAVKSGSVTLTKALSLVPCFTKNSSGGGETGGGDTPTPTTYPVTFNMELMDELIKNGTKQSNRTFNLSSINYADWAAVREGATFLGWATSTSSCPSAVKSGSVTLTKAISLVPCFEVGEYIVTFNMDDVDELLRDGLTQNTNTFKLDKIAFSDWEANRTGTTFLGWSESSECIAPIKSGTITLKRNMSFYPCFDGDKKYNVSFDVSGGKLYYDSKEVPLSGYKLNKIDYSKFTAKKEGYIFNGWSTNSGCTTNGKKTGTVNIKTDTKYYACFSVDNNSSSGPTIIDNPKTGSTLFYAIIIIGGIALTYAIYNHIVLKEKSQEN